MQPEIRQQIINIINDTKCHKQANCEQCNLKKKDCCMIYKSCEIKADKILRLLSKTQR